MTSVNINYLSDSKLPPAIRQQIVDLAKLKIMPGSALCLALLGDKLLGAVSSRISGMFARIDFMCIDPDHRKTKLPELLLNHSLKQLSKQGVNEVNTGCRASEVAIFANAGFMEEKITVPGMHEECGLIELVHPNLSLLKPRFELIGGSNMTEAPQTPKHVTSTNAHGISFDSLVSYRELSRMIMRNAKQSVYIACENIDDPVLNDRDTIAHFQHLALHAPQCDIRVLLSDDKQRSTKHSPLVDLAQRLSSFVQIRRVQDKRFTPRAWLYLSDNAHAIERKIQHGFVGKAYIESPGAVQRYNYQFEELWQHSVPSSELRRLAI